MAVQGWFKYPNSNKTVATLPITAVSTTPGSLSMNLELLRCSLLRLSLAVSVEPLTFGCFRRRDFCREAELRNPLQRGASHSKCLLTAALIIASPCGPQPLSRAASDAILDARPQGTKPQSLTSQQRAEDTPRHGLEDISFPACAHWSKN